MLSKLLWGLAGAMVLLGIISPFLGDNWQELMDRIWFPLLAAIIIAEIALAKVWHEEEMAQWRQENNPGKEEDSK